MFSLRDRPASIAASFVATQSFSRIIANRSDTDARLRSSAAATPL
jgi:hypothetical protein